MKFKENKLTNQFLLPKKFYGRKRELKIFKKTFRNVAEGNRELLFVSGYSGIGKSFLVSESKKYINSKNSFFVSGKFDQFKRNVPYKGIIQAFQELINQILNNDENSRNDWKNRILESLGPNGQVIINLIPELELLIGKQPDIPELGPIENQNRFMIYFHKFVNIFAKIATLIIFIDDLQWADIASLTLLKYLINNTSKESFLIIGAYRHNEVNEKHPLHLIMKKLKKENIYINEILLNPLKINDLNELIFDTIPVKKKEIQMFTRLIYNKTGGNPFFVNEFLASIYNDDLLKITHNNEKNRLKRTLWEWNYKKIENLQVTKNVGDLVINNLKKLSYDEQKQISLCACIGNRFNLTDFALISNKSEIDAMVMLSSIVKEEIIFFADGYYNFIHDSVQEAAYSLISNKEKMENHYKIAQSLLNNIKNEELENKLFYIIDQYNSCLEIITDESEKFKIIKLNFKAGIKAKQSTAYDTSLKYFKTGIKLLGDDSWKTNYNLMLSFHNETAEAAFLAAEYKYLDFINNKILKNAESLLDKVKVFEIQIHAYNAQYKLVEAVNTGCEILKKLGVSLNIKSTMLNVFIEFIKTNIALNGKSFEDFKNMPKMKNKNKIKATGIMMTIGTPAYYCATSLVPIMVLKIIRFELKYGYSPNTSFLYASYGILLAGILGKIDLAYKFGQFALSLIKGKKTHKLHSKTTYLFIIFIKHWKHHLNTTLEPLLDNYQKAIELGDPEYAALSVLMYCKHLFFCGEKLSFVDMEMEKYSLLCEKLGQYPYSNSANVIRQFVLNLMGKSDNVEILTGSSIDETEMFKKMEIIKNNSEIGHMYFYKSVLNYLFYNYKDAFFNILKSKKYAFSFFGQVHFQQYIFYFSLIIIMNYNSFSIINKIKYFFILINNQKMMKKWAKFCPENFLNKYYLIEAEIMRIRNKDIMALSYYDKSISLAKKYNYLNEEALANELIAKYYFKQNIILNGISYMKEAYNCYKKWGAEAKIRHLKDMYPDFENNL